MNKLYTEAEVMRYMTDAANAAIYGYKQGCKKYIMEGFTYGIIIGIGVCVAKTIYNKTKAQHKEEK